MSFWTAMNFGCLGAVMLGFLGFVAGFVGPMIFLPGSHQGPLIGIFLTGPAGVVVGGVAGIVYGLVRQKRAASNQRPKRPPEAARRD